MRDNTKRYKFDKNKKSNSKYDHKKKENQTRILELCFFYFSIGLLPIPLLHFVTNIILFPRAGNKGKLFRLLVLLLLLEAEVVAFVRCCAVVFDDDGYFAEEEN